jgi:hypothetical protein
LVPAELAAGQAGRPLTLIEQISDLGDGEQRRASSSDAVLVVVASVGSPLKAPAIAWILRAEREPRAPQVAPLGAHAWRVLRMPAGFPLTPALTKPVERRGHELICREPAGPYVQPVVE